MDDEIQVSFSGKKKRLISSSSSDDDQNVVRQKGDNTRSSERIRKRQRRTFSLPSRDDIWRDIPNEKHVEREIRKLTPKKLINNFTKENNRYNYDPVYTSGEESLCDFIDDETSTGTSESESELRKKRHKRKVKHYHPRIVKESSSDTDSEGNKNKLGSEETDSEIEVKLRRNSAKSKSKCIVSDSENEDSRQCLAVSNAKKKLYDDSDCKGSEQNDSEDDVIAAIDRNRGLIIEDSDDDDDVGENDTQSVVKVEMTQTQLNVNVGTDAESAGAVQNGTELVAKVKVEPDIVNVDNERNRLDIVNKNSETEIKVENNAHQVAVKFKERNNDSVNASLEGTSENKCETTKHDSGILADCEGFEASDSNESTSFSENEGDCESSDSDIDKSSDTDKDVVSERTRVSMVKKRKKKEKLFQKFREARALKLQKEVNRRKSETKSEAGQTEKTD